MNPQQLATAVAEFRRVQEGLMQAFPELAEDHAALIDMTEGLTSASDLVAVLVRRSRADEAYANALTAMIRDMTDRRSRYDARADRHRLAAQRLMDACELRRVEMADFTASIRAVPGKVEIDDEALLPDDLCRIVRQPDKAKIKEALAAGTIPGAHMTNGSESLTVRTK